MGIGAGFNVEAGRAVISEGGEVGSTSQVIQFQGGSTGPPPDPVDGVRGNRSQVDLVIRDILETLATLGRTVSLRLEPGARGTHDDHDDGMRAGKKRRKGM